MPSTKERIRSQPRTARPRNAVAMLAQEAVVAVLDKKALDITVLDMRAVSGVADCFVVCNGETDRQVKAVADAVRGQIREEAHEKPWHTEGMEHLQWVLIDYVDLVVHVFMPEKRTFYDLERLWGDAPRLEITAEMSEAEARHAVIGFLSDSPGSDSAAESA